MTEHVINQTGDRSLFIERNSGAVYVGEYVADPNDAFVDQSFELHSYVILRSLIGLLCSMAVLVSVSLLSCMMSYCKLNSD